jgi:hypothetical protein
MKTPASIVLVTFGTALGFAAATWAPNLSVRPAQAATGTWACAVADRLPDVKKAREWHGAKDVEQGMNQLAPNATAGQVVGIVFKPAFPHIVCVKN